MEFKVKDRVVHNYLGHASVRRVIKSSLDSRLVIGYIVHTDKRPDVRYNGGNHECLAWPGNLTKEGIA